MELLITAPIRIDFCLNTSESVHKSKYFYDLWTNLSRENYHDTDIDNIHYYKKNEYENYIESYDDKDKTKLEILGLNILEKTLNSLTELKNDDFIKTYFLNIIKSEIKIYDNTISILDLRIKLNKIEKKNNTLFTKECEKKVKKLIFTTLKSIAPAINKYLNFIKEYDINHILKKPNHNNEYSDYLDFKRRKKNLSILWASCALKFETTDKNVELLDSWLEDALQIDEISNIKNNANSYSLDWLKYVFRENVQNIESLWEIMFISQYYYSVIEIIVYNLKLIINESFAYNNKNKFSFLSLFKKNKIITVNESLEAISASAYIHITEYQDIKKYLKRDHLVLFNKISEIWTVNDILENIEDLLSTAKGRVELIYNKISSRNNFYTDILLTSIGFFAIIDLFLSFSQYSREYTSDAMISSRGEDSNSFLYTISNFSIDSFIGSGFLVSISLLFIIFFFRKKTLP